MGQYMKRSFTLFLVLASLTVMAAWWKGTTPLMDAAEEGDINTVKALLDKGEDVNKTGPHYTALMVASARGRTDVVKLLIDRGADVNVKVTIDNLDCTILEVAKRAGNREVIQLIEKAGVKE